MTRTILLSALVFSLFMVVFTKYSFVGFWFDSVLIGILLVSCFFMIFKSGRGNSFLSTASKVIWSLAFAFCLFLGFRFFANPFFADYFKLRTFSSISVNGRVFNAYFKPVGAYSGGYGNFWITERLRYFPLLEKQVYFERAVHHDFNDDNWDGEPTNNYKVATNYVLEEVVRKGF